MELECFTVWDAKAKAYIQPFWAMNEQVAQRMFATAVNDPQHDFNIHAEDYSLFKLGAFDQVTGEMIISEIECIARAHELKGTANE